MRSITKFPPAFIAILALVFAVSTASVAKEKYSKFPNIKIKNFGQMDDRFYRGARPDEEDYKALAEIGIKTIIDLTDNSREYEQPAVEAAGLRYVNIPMVDKSYPSIDQVNEFLKVVDDPETGKFYVHCAGGRHRTGVVGAVYRFHKDNWNLEQVMTEMEQYDFNSGFGHGKQKDFVKDYWKQFQAKQATVTTAVTN
ncbi:MAG TPA: dual specificity protein phosphatase family protein [Pyrinomonadaceae bacterium]|nr:dual specificity protein phosphatase family protein [Pyrinomonadaceae bacterium]